MRKIRQHNDIDIVVKLKNDEGAVLNPALIKEYKVFLTQLGYRRRIEDYQILPDGRIGFRFHAADQRLGVYSIIVTAVTTDDRVFTTDVCNAFALVRCSCDAEDGSSDAEIEALEVDASFEITAWGGGDDGTVQTSLQYYDDGSGEVVPVKHPDLSTQPSILPYKFAGNYVYEQMVWVDGEKFNDNHIDEIDLIKFQDYRLDIKSAVLIGHHVFIVGREDYGNYIPLPYDNDFCFSIASNEKRIFLKRNEPIAFHCKGAWVRVVWTSEPNAGEYYYDSGQNVGSIEVRNDTRYEMEFGTGRGGRINIVGPGESVYFPYEIPILQNFINGTDYLVFEGYPGTQCLMCQTDKGIAIYNYEVSFPLKIHLEGNESSHKNISLFYVSTTTYMAIKNRQPVKFIFYEKTT